LLGVAAAESDLAAANCGHRTNAMAPRRRRAETEDDEEEIYEVQKIVDKRTMRDGGIEYRVRWLGYGESDDTCAHRPTPAAHTISVASCVCRESTR
jgi:hypothetical protein